MNPVNHDSAEDLCPFCKKRQAWDTVTNLCGECHSRLLDAINDTLPNIDSEYNPEITEKERDNEIVSLGAEFHLSPETMRALIISLDQQDDDQID